MEAHLVAIERTAWGLLVIVSIAGFLLAKRHWLLGTSGVGLAVGLAMLAASKFQLWEVSWLAGQAVLLAAVVTLSIAALRARNGAKAAGGQP